MTESSVARNERTVKSENPLMVYCCGFERFQGGTILRWTFRRHEEPFRYTLVRSSLGWIASGWLMDGNAPYYETFDTPAEATAWLYHILISPKEYTRERK